MTDSQHSAMKDLSREVELTDDVLRTPFVKSVIDFALKVISEGTANLSQQVTWENLIASTDMKEDIKKLEENRSLYFLCHVIIRYIAAKERRDHEH